MNLPIDPPDSAARPWVACRFEVLRDSDAFTNTIQLQDLLTSLRVKYGVSSDTTAYLFKVSAVKIWTSYITTDGDAFNPFVTQTVFYDPDEAEGYGIQTVVDTCKGVTPCRTGLNYGKVIGNKIYSLGDISKKLATVQVSGTDFSKGRLRLVAHVSGHWSYATSV